MDPEEEEAVEDTKPPHMVTLPSHLSHIHSKLRWATTVRPRRRVAIPHSRGSTTRAMSTPLSRCRTPPCRPRTTTRTTRRKCTSNNHTGKGRRTHRPRSRCTKPTHLSTERRTTRLGHRHNPGAALHHITLRAMPILAAGGAVVLITTIEDHPRHR